MGGQKYSDRARSERTQRKAAEAELERLRVQWPPPHSLALPATEFCAQLQVRQREAAAAVSELESLSSPVRGAIDQERTQLHAHLLQAESSLAEVTGPLQCVLELALCSVCLSWLGGQMRDEVSAIDEESQQVALVAQRVDSPSGRRSAHCSRLLSGWNGRSQKPG